MNDLDPGAKALIDAAREGDDPSLADRHRIKHTVLLRVATIGAAASASGAATAGTLSLGAKLGAAVLVASLVGGGTVGVLKLRDARQAASPAKHHQAPPTRTLTLQKPEGTAAETAPVAIPEMVVSARPENRTRRPDKLHTIAEPMPQSASAEDQINSEVAVLKRAREALRLGHPAQALQALAEYDRLFASGALAEERQAMAAIALCRLQPGPASRAQGEAFIRSAPASPLLERVRAACITPAPKSTP
jgi:hypothetical protein